jgi:hypothetical protein
VVAAVIRTVPTIPVPHLAAQVKTASSADVVMAGIIQKRAAGRLAHSADQGIVGRFLAAIAIIADVIDLGAVALVIASGPCIAIGR